MSLRMTCFCLFASRAHRVAVIAMAAALTMCPALPVVAADPESPAQDNRTNDDKTQDTTKAKARTADAKVTDARSSGKNSVNSMGGDMYLRQITLDEAAQFISQAGNTSIVVTSSVASKVVSLYLRGATVDSMVKNLSRAAGVWYRFDSQTNTYILMSGKEYQQDIAIARDETIRSFTLRHHNVVSIANALAALFGDRVSLAEPVEEMPPTNMGSTARTQGGNNARGDSRGQGVMDATGAVTRRSATSGRSRLQGGGADLARDEVSRLSQAALSASLDADSSQIRSIDIADLQRGISVQGTPIHIAYNLLHNMLLVRTSDESALQDIEKLVADMDRPPRQVLLEMRIVEVELGNDFRSIFDMSLSGKNATRGPSGLGRNVTEGAIFDADGNASYPRNAASLGNFTSENAATAVWQIVSDNLRLRMQLLEGENRVNVLATPMLVASNNQPARLFIGDEQVLVTGAESDTTTGTTGASRTTITIDTERRNVGQTLIILPRINADRSVTLTIDQDNSRINVGGARIPLVMNNDETMDYPIDTVNTANLQVTVHARDGLTVAVGGMISQRVSDAEEKVPFLGDIPGLGALFKKTARGNTRKQIVLLITPRVMETAEEADSLAQEKEAALRQMDSGKPLRAWKTASVFDPDSAVPGAFGTRPVPAAPPNEAKQAEAQHVAPGGTVARLEKLARAAAAAMHESDDAPAPDGFLPLDIPPELAEPRRLDAQLEIVALRAWQADRFYVTAIRARNLDNQSVTLTPDRVKGKWAAIVAERPSLAPAGDAADRTLIYAISRLPYREAIAP